MKVYNGIKIKYHNESNEIAATLLLKKVKCSRKY